MTINVTNGSLASLSGTLSASSNCFLPEEVSVSGGTVSYNATTGVYTITPTTATISVTAQGEQAFTCVLNQLSGYTTLSGGTHTLQVRSVAAAHAIGELSTAVSFTMPYPITYNLTNCTVTLHGGGTAPAGIYPNGTIMLDIAEDTGYELPNSATVVGATAVYDKNNKTLTLSNPTTDVAVTIVCTRAIVPPSILHLGDNLIITDNDDSATHYDIYWNGTLVSSIPKNES